MTSKNKLDLADEMESLGLPLDYEGAVRCVFSTTEIVKVGTGTTTRKHASKQYCYVEQQEDGNFSVSPINENYLPSGESRVIVLKTLAEKYVPELEFFEEKTLPAMDQLEEHLDDGDLHREEGRHYSAEREYNKALGMDRQNMRALFSLGLTYLEMQNMDKARDMMDAILGVKTAFSGKNEHLYNEFGISLRKAGLFDEAVKYYSEAIKYVKNDQNLYYNLARANYERNNYQACVDALGMCYAIDPEMEASSELFNIILRMADKPHLAEQNNKSPVPRSIVDSIHEIQRGDGPQVPSAAQPEDAPLDEAASAPEIGRARAGGPEDRKGKKKSSESLSFKMD